MELEELNSREMLEKGSQNKPKIEEIKVEWFGVDGLLILLYAILAAIYAIGILNRVDWVIGIMAPAAASIMTTLIFLRYLFEVFTFGKKHECKK